MLFSSSIERMNRIRPVDEDGERLPKTASWRASQGAITARNRTVATTAAQTGSAGGASIPAALARR